jgi:hypothetical protein
MMRYRASRNRNVKERFESTLENETAVGEWMESKDYIASTQIIKISYCSKVSI